MVHFICFWQALQKIQDALECTQDNETQEPLAGEAAAFRDRILRMFDQRCLTRQSFADEMTQSVKVSSDAAAWACVAHQAAVAAMVDASDPIPLHEASSILLLWLIEICEDYCFGERSFLVRAVKDVLKCSMREAALQLGACAWDVEAALRRHFLGNSTLGNLDACVPVSSGWSSHAIKLRRLERECPICAEAFKLGKEPMVTRCCFQCICTHCASYLSANSQRENELLLRCPFCRKVEAMPDTGLHRALPPPSKPQEDLVSTLADSAKQLIEETGRACSALLSV